MPICVNRESVTVIFILLDVSLALLHKKSVMVFLQTAVLVHASSILGPIAMTTQRGCDLPQFLFLSSTYVLNTAFL